MDKHNFDNEEAFYKMYYQLLYYPLSRNQRYQIFVDGKTNRLRDRTAVLERHLVKNSGAGCNVHNMPSHESVLIQLCDLFTGAVCSSVNGVTTSIYKRRFIEEFEKLLGRRIYTPTRLGAEKVDVFLFPKDAKLPKQPQGG